MPPSDGTGEQSAKPEEQTTKPAFDFPYKLLCCNLLPAKKIIGVIFFFLIFAGSNGQVRDTLRDYRPKLVISANLYGSAFLLSLNIEKLFFIKPAFSLTANMGIGFNVEFNLSSDTESKNYTILPHHLTALYGSNKGFLEYGIGGSIGLAL